MPNLAAYNRLQASFAIPPASLPLGDAADHELSFHVAEKQKLFGAGPFWHVFRQGMQTVLGEQALTLYAKYQIELSKRQDDAAQAAEDRLRAAKAPEDPTPAEITTVREQAAAAVKMNYPDGLRQANNYLRTVVTNGLNQGDWEALERAFKDTDAVVQNDGSIPEAQDSYARTFAVRLIQWLSITDTNPARKQFYENLLQDETPEGAAYLARFAKDFVKEINALNVHKQKSIRQLTRNEFSASLAQNNLAEMLHAPKIIPSTSEPGGNWKLYKLLQNRDDKTALARVLRKEPTDINKNNIVELIYDFLGSPVKPENQTALINMIGGVPDARLSAADKTAATEEIVSLTTQRNALFLLLEPSHASRKRALATWLNITEDQITSNNLFEIISTHLGYPVSQAQVIKFKTMIDKIPEADLSAEQRIEIKKSVDMIANQQWSLYQLLSPENKPKLAHLGLAHENINKDNLFEALLNYLGDPLEVEKLQNIQSVLRSVNLTTSPLADAAIALLSDNERKTTLGRLLEAESTELTEENLFHHLNNLDLAKLNDLRTLLDTGTPALSDNQKARILEEFHLRRESQLAARELLSIPDRKTALGTLLEIDAAHLSNLTEANLIPTVVDYLGSPINMTKFKNFQAFLDLPTPTLFADTKIALIQQIGVQTNGRLWAAELLSNPVLKAQLARVLATNQDQLTEENVFDLLMTHLGTPVDPDTFKKLERFLDIPEIPAGVRRGILREVHTQITHARMMREMNILDSGRTRHLFASIEDSYVAPVAPTASLITDPNGNHVEAYETLRSDAIDADEAFKDVLDQTEQQIAKNGNYKLTSADQPVALVKLGQLVREWGVSKGVTFTNDDNAALAETFVQASGKVDETFLFRFMSAVFNNSTVGNKLNLLIATDAGKRKLATSLNKTSGLPPLSYTDINANNLLSLLFNYGRPADVHREVEELIKVLGEPNNKIAAAQFRLLRTPDISDKIDRLCKVNHYLSGLTAKPTIDKAVVLSSEHQALGKRLTAEKEGFLTAHPTQQFRRRGENVRNIYQLAMDPNSSQQKAMLAGLNAFIEDQDRLEAGHDIVRPVKFGIETDIENTHKLYTLLFSVFPSSVKGYPSPGRTDLNGTQLTLSRKKYLTFPDFNAWIQETRAKTKDGRTVTKLTDFRKEKPSGDIIKDAIDRRTYMLNHGAWLTVDPNTHQLTSDMPDIFLDAHYLQKMLSSGAYDDSNWLTTYVLGASNAFFTLTWDLVGYSLHTAFNLAAMPFNILSGAARLVGSFFGLSNAPTLSGMWDSVSKIFMPAHYTKTNNPFSNAAKWFKDSKEELREEIKMAIVDCWLRKKEVEGLLADSDGGLVLDQQTGKFKCPAAERIQQRENQLKQIPGVQDIYDSMMGHNDGTGMRRGGILDQLETKYARRLHAKQSGYTDEQRKDIALQQQDRAEVLSQIIREFGSDHNGVLQTTIDARRHLVLEYESAGLGGSSTRRPRETEGETVAIRLPGPRT